MHKLFSLPVDVRPTAYPQIVEAVEMHFEGMKLLFDQVSLGIVDPIAYA